MFETAPAPRLFAVPSGADFPAVLAAGLRARLAGQPPEAMARVDVIVNTARMQIRLREALIAQGGGFLPRISQIADLAQEGPGDPPLRTRLALAQAVRAFLLRQPDLAPTSAGFALADSLYRLLDEMQGEGAGIDRLQDLDVSNHSEHWTRSLRFIRLITDHYGTIEGGQGRLRQAVEALRDGWRADPPDHPIIVAGSTGSRGPSALLMKTVAGLPQGAIVLPGFDFDMPGGVWDRLENPLHDEDHPQFRYARLMSALGVVVDQVARWSDAPAPDPGRNALVSLALRPAPVTDQWLSEGATLGDLDRATRRVSLIEANTPRDEALAIALRLRQAVVDGQKAALITPDRTLARRVTAALDRWHLRPDDSAGRPLAMSAPGRFMRHCAAMLAEPPSAEALIALLKHPICHSAAGRGDHLRHTRDLELHLRARAIVFPDAEALAGWAARKADRCAWADWLSAALTMAKAPQEQSLSAWVAQHLSLANHLDAGAPGDKSATGELWAKEAGEEARALFDDLDAEAAYGGTVTAGDYFAMLETILIGREVREPVQSHPGVMIWGTLEARAQGADLVILGGLNEGTWPAANSPDPWFNRKMRLDAGLLLPERQIGLAAHDFQQAVAAPEVVLARAVRTDEAETVASRWLNRLTNLIAGLPDQNGPQALAAMRARGRDWLDLAAAFESDLSEVPPDSAARNPRPSPAPPIVARPRELAVTRIETLIRDPYAIYAQYVLGLRELDPLAPEADARLKGTVLHRVLEVYVAAHPPGAEGNVESFMECAATVLAQDCPWHSVRQHWLARLSRVAKAFVAWNARLDGVPVLTEEKGRMDLVHPRFTLTGKPDRIDRTPEGALRLYDYKTGALPTKPMQEHFNKQLILLAMMVEEGGFAGLAPAPVAAAEYIGMGTGFKTASAPVDRESLVRTREELERLIAAYQQSDQGFAAMRAVKEEAWIGPYHPLARRGEWQPSDPAQTIMVGDHDG